MNLPTIPSSWIGIDISKAWLDIADTGEVSRLANKPTPLTAWTASLQGRDVIVVFEATGHYDTALRHALAASGIAHARVNPQRARDFASACGRLVKTDTLDAAMLAEMGRALCLQPDPPPDQTLETLVLLNKRRDQLVAMRQQERARRSDQEDPQIQADLEAHIAWLSQAIVDLEAAIRNLIEAAPPLAEAEALMRSTPGVGAVTAATLIALARKILVTLNAIIRTGKPFAA